MADDDSRSEDAEKRPGKSSKPSKRPSKSEDAKAKAGKKSDKKSDKADDDAKPDKVEKSEKGKAVKTAAKSEAKDDKPKKKPGLLRRFGIFIREIFEQLRKVVYPTRKQLLTYTAVVLVFVTIMIGVIYGLDYVMSKGVMWVFGGNDK
ncbi:preprotein translocase subunit SecE [Stackebrandtia nassauensis]|uniref:Protein translocase subunit SecE n=1 Tax=Stackebrandtia nassauensis (strain DSM 44728 / CIP 108903 / NRRL B-16338 / NBRC 102104 / LLR-40K-21) TaxID=446470 RepID=D3Q064_STANL|nr:preprotein translocase subunit SecE [Stackebrandtia nassauensis]ADD45593.1 preprotein translocase, SecE subunit [Stackebrandtia nassauensis DSM 44728]